MSTIEDGTFIRKLIGDDGRFEDDPQVLAIYRYYNPAVHKELYMIAWMESDINSMFVSPFCVNPVLLWHQTTGMTPDGFLWSIA